MQKLCDVLLAAPCTINSNSYHPQCLMLASSFAGIIWYWFGPALPYTVTGVVAVLVAAYFLIAFREKE